MHRIAGAVGRSGCVALAGMVLAVILTVFFYKRRKTGNNR
jgi:hypothetical protein